MKELNLSRENSLKDIIPAFLNIHGYGGTSENSAYAALKANGYENIISPEIDYELESPDEILERLRSIIAEKETDILVGTSLGGFFAAVLSAELHLPVILINPFLQPFLTFPEYIHGYIKAFGMISEIDNEHVCCIIGEEDELSGDQQLTKDLFENSRFRIISGGNHYGPTLPLKEYFADVMKFFQK